MQGTSFAGRIFPNNGLTADQISNAIRTVGFETKYVDFTKFANQKDLLEFKELIYAYLIARIPIVFGFDLYVRSKKASSDLWDWKGRHAVAVAGYGLSRTLLLHSNDQIDITAHRLQKLYVHDDQTGPFSKMEIEGSIQIQHKERNKSTLSLSTSWYHADYDYRAVPALLLIPLSHEIRIDYSRIKEFAFGIDFCIRKSGSEQLNKFWNENVSWDIALTGLNDYKMTIFSDDDISSEEKIKVLTSSLPKFFWCCSLELNGKKAIDFLFDASDISSGDIFIRIVEYQSGFCRGMIKWLETLLSPIQQQTSAQPLIPEHSSLQRILRLILQSYREKVK
jgi:hypothetical protein